MPTRRTSPSHPIPGRQRKIRRATTTPAISKTAGRSKPPGTAPSTTSARTARTRRTPNSLPPALLREVTALANHLQHSQAFEQIGRGPNEIPLGQVVVLEGPDTTLRTHAAQALATKLGKSVYRVRLTELTSGPATRRRQATEQACLQADASKSLLLIEEADALFATKTGASPRAARELTELLSRLRANSSASILSASHIRKIDPSILDAVRAVLRLAGTCTS